MWPFPKKDQLHPRHKDLIDGNIVELSKRTKNLTELLRCLETAGLLNMYEIALINKPNTNAERCVKLYQKILRKPSGSFKTLVKALLRTGNEDLARFLYDDDDKAALDREIIREAEQAARERRRQNEKLKQEQEQAIEDAANKPSRSGPPRRQTWCSIIVSALIIFITSSIPIFLAVWMFKAWMDKTVQTQTGESDSDKDK